jgi:hypothetical protein
MSLERERAVLTEVVQRHRLAMSELILRTARDPEDDATKEEIKHAARDLRRFGLVRYRDDDEVVEPTDAGLRAFEIFTT